MIEHSPYILASEEKATTTRLQTDRATNNSGFSAERTLISPSAVPRGHDVDLDNGNGSSHTCWTA